MQKDIRRGIEKYNERGVLSRTGPAFHTPSEFALKNLYYVVWSDQYQCNRSYRVTHDYLENFSIIHVIRGEMEFVYEDQILHVGENEAILMDFRKRHSYRALTDDLEKWEFLFNGNAAEACYNLIAENYGNVFSADSRVRTVFNMLKEELCGTFPQDHKISYLVQLLFYAIMEKHIGKLSPDIERAIQYMYQHYPEQIRIDEIASHVSLSRSYFSKLFQKETGYSPREYLLNIRINAAQDLLMGQSASVAEVAELCGFASISHFSRAFKEKIGKSPKMFRNTFFLSI